jgi:xanthine dehydrogenase accessory factor
MDNLIIVRGGGDLATGTIHRLRRCGFPVIALETKNPGAIRRRVSFSEAVYDGVSEVEGVTCQLALSVMHAMEIIRSGDIAMLVDERCDILKEIQPWALVDCIMAKKNLGTTRDMAKKTIAIGPGFTAGKDVDLVIETKRGHDLGRIIESGRASEDTEVPGLIEGFASERVIYSAYSGVLRNTAQIGDLVKKGETIAIVLGDEGQHPVQAEISGVLRGNIWVGFLVHKGLKIADIDPRQSERSNCFTISDKARCIAGSVLEGLLYLDKRD